MNPPLQSKEIDDLLPAKKSKVPRAASDTTSFLLDRISLVHNHMTHDHAHMFKVVLHFIDTIRNLGVSG